MYCKKCGNEIQEGDKFCGSCGTPTETEKTQIKSTNEKESKNKKSSFSLIRAGLLILIVIAAALLFFLWQQNKKKEQLNQLNEQIKTADTILSDYIIDEEDNIEEWKQQSNWAIENENLEETEKLMLQWEDLKQQVEKENKERAADKQKELEEADTSKAYKSELKSIDDWKKKIEAYLKSNKYKKADELFAKWQELIDAMQIPANPLNISVDQVDTTEFPKIRLYLDLKDEEGSTPQKLSKDVFELKESMDESKPFEQIKITKLEQLNQKEQLNVNMVADVSGSMDGEPIQSAKYAMLDFLNQVQFSIGDKVELTVFSDAVEVYQPFTNNKEALDSQIQSLMLGDMTSLYDALYAAINRTAMQNGAKCVIAFTDGRDNSSASSLESVIAAANRYYVPIYIIGVGDDLDYTSLAQIGERTSGFFEHIDTFASMQDIYKRIYQKQKELYLLEYKTKNAGSIISEHNIQLKADTRQWQGESDFYYTPNILQTVDDSVVVNGDEIDMAIGSYLRGFIKAINANDFSYMENTVVKGSPIEKEQRAYIKRDLSEQLQNFEITEKEMKGDSQCIVTVRETYDIDKPNEPLHMLVQEAKYDVRKQSNGQWKIYSFYEKVKKLQKLNY